MPRALSRRVRAVIALTAAFATALVPVTAGAQDLATVQARRAELEQRVDAANLHLEQVETQLHEREQEVADLERRSSELEAQLADTRGVLQDRARAAFKRGGGLTTLEALLSGQGPTDAIDRASSLDVLSRRDATSIEAATALTTQLAQTETLRRAALQDLQALEAEAEATAAQLTEDLEAAKALEADVKARAARQKQISRGAQNGTYACMMQRPYSYIDSWGFSRSGGRHHEGTDVMAPYGNEVYAFTHGRVSHSTNRLGGTSLYLYGDDGNRYYYAHLDSYAGNVPSGSRVEAGQLIAYNGNSGNARGGAAHVHFEVHPGGGGATNPYPWLTPVCTR